MIKILALFTVSCATFLSPWQYPQAQKIDQPLAKQISVNGTTIRYWEQGKGAPVIFVHGAISDHRYWEPQREAVAKRYRFIALDRRYFGTAPWPDKGALNSQATHVADLAAFIRELKSGPVFLVGTSGGAVVSLITAVHHPELVRGLFLNEPGMESIVTEPSDQKLMSEFRNDPHRAAARAAARAGNMVEAAKIFAEFANGTTGIFDALPPARKVMHTENARTLGLDVPAPEPITCAQLGQLKVAVTITKGELTKTPSRITAEAAHRCIPGSQLITFPAARHGAPWQNPSAFNEALLAFLERTNVRSLRVHDYDMAYVERGSGEPIVLLHGGLSDYRQFSALIELLSPEYRVIAPSRRHHYPELWDGKRGNASTRQHVQDLAAFLRKLNAGPVHLVGHSRGAGVALYVASKHPKLLRTLTILEGGGMLVPGDRERSRESFAKMMSMYEQGKMDEALAQLFDSIHGGGAWSKASEARRQGFRDNAWTIKGLSDADPYTCDDAAGISVPVLLIGGEKSSPNFAKGLDALQSCLKQSERIKLPNSGHNMTRDNPIGLSQALLNFISRR